MKYIFGLIKLTLLLLIICASFLTWSVYTQSGRDFLTHIINGAPLPDGIVLNIESIHSILPLHIKVARFTLHEDQTVWLDIEDVELRADALQYFKNKSISAEAEAEKVLLRNLPSGESSESTSDNSPSTDLLDLSADIILKVHTIQLEDFMDDGPVDLQNVDISAHYSNTIKVDLSGSVVSFGEPLYIKGNVSGSLDNLQAQLHLNSKYFKYQEYDIANLELHGDFNGLPAQAKGKLTFSGNPMQLGNIAGNIDIEHADDTIQVGVNSIDSDFFTGKGFLSYDMSKGNASASLEGRLQSHSVRDIYSLETGDFDIDIRLLDNAFSGSAKVNVSTVKGYTSQIDTLSFTASVQDFPLAKEFILGGVGQMKLDAKGVKTESLTLDTLSLEGSLSEGKANLNLTALGPDLASNLAGSVEKKGKDQLITLEESNLEYNKVKMSLASPTQVLWQEEQAEIPNTKFNIGEGDLSLAGMVGMRSINLKVNLNLPLAPFGTLFLPPEHFVEGNLSSDVHIQGDLESPQIKGELTLKDGLYENIEYGAYINDIQSRVDASGQRVEISSFKAKSHNEGDLSLSGYVDLVADKVDVSFTGNSFKLLQSAFLEAFVKDMSMKVAGVFDDLECSGNLVFEKGSLDIGVNQASAIKEIKECKKPGVSPEGAKATESKPLPITLNIGISSQPQFKVYGRGLDSIWAGELQVKGNASEPLISGDIGLERGSFKLLNTVLELEEGNVIFSGSPENIPYFKIVTTTDNDEYKMKVVIRGTPEKIYFDFSSTPSLPRDEIISQILFGKLSKDLTALEAVQLARSISALTGGGSSMDIMGELSNVLGVDLISVDFDQQQSAASIHIEKRLNDRVKIVTDQSSNVEDSSVGVEVKVFENVTVSTEHGLVVPDERVSVNYKVDY